MNVGPVEDVRISGIAFGNLSHSPLRDSIGRINISSESYSIQRDIEVESWIKTESEFDSISASLVELSYNKLVQPVYVISTEYSNKINGFYKLQNVRRESLSPIAFIESLRFELIYVGNTDTHIRGYEVTSLSTVTNDWNI